MAFTLSAVVTQTAAHPPTDPDHGINETTFAALWSGDADDLNASELHAQLESDPRAMEILANGTDVPFSSPPRAVEQWNQGDHDEFPRTDLAASTYPPDADLAQGAYIKDAHATIFTVQPSTRTRITSGTQRRYVAPSGEVLGTVDYRIQMPADIRTEHRRVTYQLLEHRIEETTLFVGDSEEATASGSHTPTLSYSLESYLGSEHTLTLETNVTVDVRQRVQHCQTYDNDSNCIEWNSTYSVVTENVTATDSMTVREYDLGMGGFYTRYPDGDLGLIVYKGDPWAGYSLPGADVNGVWRFYTARDQSWDQLVTSTGSDTSIAHSPAHPVEVYAYPIRTGPTVAPQGQITLLDIYGDPMDPPTLPSAVHLDTLDDQYTASYGIATRVETDAEVEDIRAEGIVRGVSTTETDSFYEVPHRRSNLTLRVVNSTMQTATVELTLRDGSTGAGINTSARNATLTFDGEPVATNDSGTLTRTVSRTTGAVSATYEPGRWWLHDTAYVGDSDTVALRSGPLQIVWVLFRIGMPVSLFCLAAFLVDRITGWELWPFWRRL